MDFRTEKMLEMFHYGKTLQEIGDFYNLSRERIRQILSKHKNYSRNHGGRHLKSINREKKYREKILERKSQIYNCSKEEYLYFRSFHKQLKFTPLMPYLKQKRSAKDRGISWEISLKEWWEIWQQSGKFHLRGLGKELYCMSRIGDIGPYKKGNVFIQLQSENSKTSHVPKGRKKKSSEICS